MEPLEVLALGTVVISIGAVGLAWGMSRAFDRRFGVDHRAEAARPAHTSLSAVEVKSSGYARRPADMPAKVTAQVHFSAPPHV